MKRTLHVLVCWDHRYSSNTIEQHRQIIEMKESVWWGKFREARFRTHTRKLEPLGDGPLGDRDEFIATIHQQIRAGIETHLYVCDPDPALFSLHVGDLGDIRYSETGEIPEGIDPESVPAYYFTDKKRSEQRFFSHYWFEVMKDLIPLEALYMWELTDHSNTEVPQQLRFSIPNFYPMPVTTSRDEPFFRTVPEVEVGDDWPKREPEQKRNSAASIKTLIRMIVNDHHLPRGLKKFIERLAGSEYITRFRYIMGFKPSGDGYWFKEVTNEGDLVCVYSSDWSIKFMVYTTARNRAEGLWLTDTL